MFEIVGKTFVDVNVKKGVLDLPNYMAKVVNMNLIM
jgi:hypothetical protein